jgi:peptidoglycan/LPS O-acetylase OafA/YrhL
MALVLETKYRDVGLFYSNRLLRLLPAYFVMMAISAVIVFGFNASATSTQEIFATAYGHPATAALFVTENLALVGQDLLYWFRIAPDGTLPFDPTGAPPTDASPVAWQALLVPQSWSLSLELMFYALAPILARLSWRWLAALAAASIALRFAGYLLPLDYGLWQGRFFPTSLFLFLLGMLAHRALLFAGAFPKATGFVLSAAVLALVAFLPMTHVDPEIGRWIAYAAIAAAIPFVFHAFKDIAIDRWIGDLSYPIYLSHLGVVGLVLTFNPPQPAWVAVGGTLAASVALLMLVDRPVDRWRQARTSRAARNG